MVYKKTENAMKVMIADTVLALCRNKLPFQCHVRVEGLIGITLDDEEIFLVNVNESISKDEEENKEPSAETNFTLACSSRLRKREKRRFSEVTENTDSDDHKESLRKKPRQKRTRYRNKCRPGDQTSSKPLTRNVDVKYEDDNNTEGMGDQFVAAENCGHGETYTTACLKVKHDESQESTDVTAQPDTETTIGIEHLQNLAMQLSKEIQPGNSLMSQSTGSLIPAGSTLQGNQSSVKKETTFCHFCWKDCLTATGLMLHIPTHTGEKPFKCSICPAEFNEESNLIRHLRSHTGADTVYIEPYKCDNCLRPFSAMKELNKHKDTCFQVVN